MYNKIDAAQIDINIALEENIINEQCFVITRNVKIKAKINLSEALTVSLSVISTKFSPVFPRFLLIHILFVTRKIWLPMTSCFKGHFFLYLH